MGVPFVQSGYNRIAGDFYPTIDDRCINGLLHHVKPAGLIVDPCAPDGSGIVDQLTAAGFDAVGLPDAMGEFIGEWIITNPPYDRRIVDKIIRRQLDRLEAGEFRGMAVLLRSGFDHAKSRKWLFDSPLYAGQIKLRFRPFWSQDRKASPIHNYVWHLWQIDMAGAPVVLYAG